MKKRTFLAHGQHENKSQARAVPRAPVCGLCTLTSVAHGALVSAGEPVQTLKTKWAEFVWTPS